MLESLAHTHGVRCISDLLVGFKYSAGAIDNQGPERFVFGFEESLGYLAGTYSRDKDATIAAMYLLELAGELKAQGQTLHIRLDELFREQGYFCDTQVSKTCAGETGQQQIRQFTQSLRSAPPAKVGNVTLTQVRDYQQDVGQLRRLPDNQVIGKIAQPVGDLLIFDGHIEHPQVPTAIRIAARPSGTEPKIKFYLFAHPLPGRRDDRPLSETRKHREEMLAAVRDAVSGWMG